MVEIVTNPGFIIFLSVLMAWFVFSVVQAINISLNEAVKRKNRKKILYFDLDGVMADYDKAKEGKTEEQRAEPGFFENLEPIDGAVEAFKQLSQYYDCHFLTTAPWSNTNAGSEKRIWVEKHLGEYAFKKLTTTHHKGLLKGDYLIDDRIANGVEDFEGEHIHFGTDQFPDWNSVIEYLTPRK